MKHRKRRVTVLFSSPLLTGCASCERLEEELYRLAEWEYAHSQAMWAMFCDLLCPEPVARKRGLLALEVMRWLAAEDRRIWGKP